MRRKSLFKKAMALALAGAMLAMTACGSSSDSSSSSSSDSTEAVAETTEVAEEATEEAAEAEEESASASDIWFDDGVTINVMVWDRGNAAPGTTTEDNTMTQWLKDIMLENYNITVEYTAVARSDSDDKLNIMMAGGSAPNIVFTYDQSLFYSYASQGGLYDLTDLYEEYGTNMKEYLSEANEGISEVDGTMYAVMKQRGTEAPRHVSYIRKDLLDEMGMEMPTNKEELETFLYAVQENYPDITPWGMSGRSDTAEMYLQYVASYVDLDNDRDAYIYNGEYIAAHPDAKEGIRKLNQYYNDKIITQEFYTDSDESGYYAAVANGTVAFGNGDAMELWDSIEVLNNGVEDATFWPIVCFDTPSGDYRLEFEYRYAMFVMIPATTSEEQAEACMVYLDWLADPDNAVQVRYSPYYTVNELGVYVEPTESEKNELGLPGTLDDLCIMNLNFDWVNDFDIMAQSNYMEQETDWASVDWYKAYYEDTYAARYIYPSYGYISDDEQTYGTDVQTQMLQWVYNCIACSPDSFDSTYESGYNELVNRGLEKILDARAEYYDSIN